MGDIIVAIGLVLVIEGLLWALMPGVGLAMLEAIEETPEGTLRMAGAAAVAAGLLIVWLVRG